MGPKFSTALAIAAALFILPPSGFAQAYNAQSSQTMQGNTQSSHWAQGNAQSNQPMQNATTSRRASREAKQMVSATAVFTSDIDARTASPGSQFRAKLQKDVQLENGPKLPAGTVLIGRIVNDTHSADQARLALQFTKADLKNGRTVPIKATIVDVYQMPDWAEADEYGVVSQPTPWSSKTTAVDQIDALSGVDLHSNIASPNSGVFVSTKKDDIKLSKDLGVELAIATQGGANQTAVGGL